jgi:predicted glycoside hydrolase/deacetylase ChbG (UPF0249 family)
MYVDEREREVETLCDPRVRAAVAANHINLTGFGGREDWLQIDADERR